MEDRTVSQPMAELIRNYILKRRNDKEHKLLKDKPNKKGGGGINYKLLKLVSENKISESGLKDVEKEITDKTTFLSEQKRHEELVLLAEKCDLDVKDIIEEYQKYLEKLDSEEREKNIYKLLKGKPKKNGSGGINFKLLEKLKSALSKEKVAGLEKKIKSEIDLLSEQKKHNMLVSQAEQENLDIKDIIEEYHQLLKKIEDKHDCNTWLSWAAEKAAGVSLATHVIKLTHSSISGTASCLYDKSIVQNNSYLTTAHVRKPVIDGTGNAALAPIANLLQLTNENGSLAEQILANDDSGLTSFSENEDQLENWIAGFKKALDKPQKSSHYRAKQVYFPVADNKYHLLSNVISSSLCQEMFIRFQKYWDAEEEEEVRGLKYSEKYSPKLCVSYPKKAIIKVTASQHQNVSMLNRKRNGRLTLLSCQPPIWKRSLKPPANKRSLFYSENQYRSHDNVKALQRLLLAIKAKELSANNPRIHTRLTSLVEDIIETVFHYVSSIQNLKSQAGWSKNAKKLKLSHQLWLDPFRDEDEFQQQRKSMDWQAEICRDFSLWLNKRLDHKQLTLGKQQEAFWQKIFKSKLREFNAMMEANQ